VTGSEEDFTFTYGVLPHLEQKPFNKWLQEISQSNNYANIVLCIKWSHCKYKWQHVLRIPKVPGSNIGYETGYPDKFIVAFRQITGKLS
jgi:hypothetical protein